MPGYFDNSRIRALHPFFFFLLLLLLLPTCTSSRGIYKRLSDTEYTSSEYRTILEKWTRKGSIHRGLRTELLMNATYRTEEFRKAFAKEYCRLYMQPPHESQKMLDDQVRAAKDYDDFLVSIYAPEKKWDDFAKKDSLWKAYLLKDGRMRTEPIEIRKVKKDRKLFEAFYPFISPWSSINIIRFKKKDQPEAVLSMELIFASPPGSTTLRWDF